MQYVPNSIVKTSFRKIGFSPKVDKCLDRVRKQNIEFTASRLEEFWPLLDIARETMTVASDEVIKNLQRKNKDIVRVAISDNGQGSTLGFFAYLPLNEIGCEALASGEFDGLSPNPSWICNANIAPQAIYLWLVFMPGALAQAIGVIAKAFDELVPHGCAVFSRAVNDHATRLNRSMGFMDAAEFYPQCKGGLLVIFPQKEPAEPIRPKTSVRLARNFEDVFQVLSMRSATYLAEQFCYHAEEFDGNDFCASHMLGFVGDDPAGCIRMRFFAGFAKIERLAVRTEYRNSRLAYELVRSAINHCREKGFTTFYGHSRLDLIKFWRVFGFKEREDRDDFTFANVKYRELIAEFDQSDTYVSLDSPPMVIIRPEGQWGVPGPLDISASESDPRRKAMLISKTRTISGLNVAK
jgi:predicted GNAT family N-acyltransferase